jgi:16S rRNA (cytidine1402-2'-O)-methyltransferase
LADLAATAGEERPAAVARELTKQFEEVRRGTVTQLAAYYRETAPRGEVVLVGGPAAAVELPCEEALRDRARALRGSGLSARDAAAELVRAAGVPRNLAYRLAQEAE